MNYSKRNQFLTSTLIQVLLVVLIGLIVAFLSTRHYLRYDMTQDKRYVLSDVSKDILASLDDNLTIKMYFSKELPSDLVVFKTSVDDLLDEMRSNGRNNVEIQYLDPSNETVKKEAIELGIPEIQMNVVAKDKYESKAGFLGMALVYQGKTEVIPVVSNSQNLEFDIMSKIKRLTDERAVRIGFLSGHGEHSIDSSENGVYTSVAEILRSYYDVTIIEISEGGAINTVDTLIIAGPKDDFTDRDQYEIDQFIMNGGNVLFLLDGANVTQDMQITQNTNGLGPLLLQYGIKLNNDLVTDFGSMANATFQQEGVSVLTPYPFWVKVTKQGITNEVPLYSDIETAVLPWVSSVEVAEKEGLETHVLMQTTENGKLNSYPFNINPDQNYNTSEQSTFGLAVYSKGKFTSFFTDKEIPPVEVTTENENDSPVISTDTSTTRETIPQRATEGGIIVLGDSDFASDPFVSTWMFPQNIGLFLLSVDALSMDQSLSSITVKNITDRSLKELSLLHKNIIKYSAILIMPLIVILFGIIRILTRKHARNTTTT